VKLLLDAHHSPRAAERLRDKGYDVVAAADDSVVVSMADEELLRHASADDRAIVTEDAKDFDRIVRAWVATDDERLGALAPVRHRPHMYFAGAVLQGTHPLMPRNGLCM